MSKTPGKKSSWTAGAISVGYRGKKYRQLEKALRALKRRWKQGLFTDLYTYGTQRR